ncbi:MAG TPA: dCTP deaminase [Planctomycetota bacterium]|nr:dCTP deaminase [Planctomycetota bacterium]
MTIKSDRWIRKMALEKKMIEPFEDRQVRKGVISYGLSSYGYDLRVADDFKIFTNVNSTVIDPKAFDERSFVDYKGPVCVVPPNSFALARTVEYLRIPRRVLTVCLGKSTYARCFRGDQRVALVDGTAPTLEDMAARAQKGEDFWGYSLGAHGRVIVTKLEAPRFIGRDSLLEIELDNGELVRATPDHVFIRRDGSTSEAHELRAGHSLMPLYRQLVRGYESVYQPLNGHLIPTHRLSDEWNIRHGVYPDGAGEHRHHRDHNRTNNRPWNVCRMLAADHIRHHNDESYGPDFDPDEHSAAIRDALARLAKDPAWKERFSQAQRTRAVAFWHDPKHAAARDALLAERQNIGPETREAHRQAMIARYANPAERERQSGLMRAAWSRDDGSRRAKQRDVARHIRLREEITEKSVLAALHEAGSIRGAAKLLQCDRSVFRRFPELVAAFPGTKTGRNHKVVAMKELGGLHDVYCLTVPEAGNFALDAGCFVGNCGIIVNVTPFEPEWEGHATLEISNTTPLPAKIYANEGLCQVLFFESDEDCETSYADKKGKYQNQPAAIVLPKM